MRILPANGDGRTTEPNLVPIREFAEHVKEEEQHMNRIVVLGIILGGLQLATLLAILLTSR